MDAAALYSLEIDVVEILEVYDAQKEGFLVELFYNIFCAFDKCVDEQFLHIHSLWCLFCVDKLREMRYDSCSDMQSVNRLRITRTSNLAQIFEQALDIDEARSGCACHLLYRCMFRHHSVDAS